MNKRILFTPVGGTDPISSSNYSDGSMLHICRYYKPDKVVMYMSKEMLEYQEQDDRYRYCLDRLSVLLNHKMEYEIIERRELTKVHEFDYFYNDFREIIEKIYAKMDESDVLLLNVSSGTPAMKSGLLVLQTLGEFPAKTIQVATPEERINEHIHKGYDVEVLWKANLDNKKEAQNRCKEIKCPSLSRIKKEEIIKKHILVYDYHAALDVTETMSKEDTKDYKDWLFLASCRAMLDFIGVDEIIKKRGFRCLPIQSGIGRKYFEYALNVDLRLRRKEYADFIRSITPLVVDLFEMILKKQFNINIDDYCSMRKTKGSMVREWSMGKLNGTNIFKVLKAEYNQGKFQGGPISSHHLRALIKYYAKDPDLIQNVDNIRNVESNIRNLAAHQIISVTEKSIKKKTGFSPEIIMDMIKNLFSYTGIPIKEEYWNSYDEMNQQILKCISVKN